MSQETIRELRAKAARAREFAEHFSHDQITSANLRKYAEDLTQEADVLQRAMKAAEVMATPRVNPPENGPGAIAALKSPNQEKK